MGTPSLKVSEMTECDNKKIANQKLLIAQNGKNNQVAVATLNNKFVNRDFPACDACHLHGAWNYTGVGATANNPSFPTDVANGKVLDDLKNIFKRFGDIWKNVNVPFQNQYEPDIKAEYIEKRYLIRDGSKNKGQDYCKYRTTAKNGGIYLYDTVPEKEFSGGVNGISKKGGYVFLASNNKNLKKDVYMEFDESIRDRLKDLGWNGKDKKLVLIRNKIKPDSKVGVTFHCHYGCGDGDENYAAHNEFNYDAHVKIEYAGTEMENDLKYFGRPSMNGGDSSPHRDNHHWGEKEGMESQPGYKYPWIKGGSWAEDKDAHLEVVEKDCRGDIPGWHGIYLWAFFYVVEVWIHKITITNI